MQFKIYLTIVWFFLSSALEAKSVSILSFNVENLFDTMDDPQKDDETFLPLAIKKHPKYQKKCSEQKSAYRQKQCKQTDWSQKQLAVKLERLAAIISQLNADLVVLVEVENRAVLELLNKHLKDQAYPHIVHLEGPDRRGIDTAILSRFEPSSEPRLHQIADPKGGFLETRAILEADFKLDNTQIFTVYAVHFPAPYHPMQERLVAINFLNALAQKKENKSSLVIAAGDFNVKAEEDSRIYRQIASKNWLVSHLESCKSCLGTNFFSRGDSWSFLDAILIWKSHAWAFENVELGLALTKHQLEEKALPLAFDPQTLKGVSDHLPILARIRSLKVEQESK